MDCGPTCLKMVTKYYGIEFSVGDMKNIDRITREGSSILDLVDAAEKLGLVSTVLEMNIDLIDTLALPVILYWKKHHFVVLFEIQQNLYFIADPSKGIIKLDKTDFVNCWHYYKNIHQPLGILMTLSIRG